MSFLNRLIVFWLNLINKRYSGGAVINHFQGRNDDVMLGYRPQDVDLVSPSSNRFASAGYRSPSGNGFYQRYPDSRSAELKTKMGGVLFGHAFHDGMSWPKSRIASGLCSHDRSYTC